MYSVASCFFSPQTAVFVPKSTWPWSAKHWSAHQRAIERSAGTTSSVKSLTLPTVSASPDRISIRQEHKCPRVSIRLTKICLQTSNTQTDITSVDSHLKALVTYILGQHFKWKHIQRFKASSVLFIEQGAAQRTLLRLQLWCMLSGDDDTTAPLGITACANAKLVLFSSLWLIFSVYETAPFSDNDLLCSKPWRLGSSLRSQSRGQERVPQVSQTLHHLRSGENHWEAHPLLNTPRYPEHPLLLNIFKKILSLKLVFVSGFSSAGMIQNRLWRTIVMLFPHLHVDLHAAELHSHEPVVVVR